MNEIFKTFLTVNEIFYAKSSMQYLYVKGCVYINPEMIEELTVNRLEVDKKEVTVFNIKSRQGFRLCTCEELEKHFGYQL